MTIQSQITRDADDIADFLVSAAKTEIGRVQDSHAVPVLLAAALRAEGSKSYLGRALEQLLRGAKEERAASPNFGIVHDSWVGVSDLIYGATNHFMDLSEEQDEREQSPFTAHANGTW